MKKFIPAAAIVFSFGAIVHLASAQTLKTGTGPAAPAQSPDPVLPLEGRPTANPSLDAIVSGSLSARANGSAATSDAGVTETASIVLNPAETLESIRHAAFASRNALAIEIGSRVDASQRAIALLEAQARNAGDHSASTLARALGEVRARQRDLRVTLRETAQTTQESAWRNTQSALAGVYEAYARAVADAETAAQVDVSAHP